MDRLAALIARSGFLAAAQGRVGRAFGLGAGAFVPWVDARSCEACVRSYDVRNVVPHTWDEGRGGVGRTLARARSGEGCGENLLGGDGGAAVSGCLIVR